MKQDMAQFVVFAGTGGGGDIGYAGKFDRLVPFNDALRFDYDDARRMAQELADARLRTTWIAPLLDGTPDSEQAETFSPRQPS